MNLINLKSAVAQLDTRKSIVLARVAGANIKVMRMDGAPYPDESHDHSEGLLVVDGQFNLTVGSEAITVRAGEIYVVPVGVAHAVAPGSTGTLVIFDAGGLTIHLNRSRFAARLNSGVRSFTVLL